MRAAFAFVLLASISGMAAAGQAPPSTTPATPAAYWFEFLPPADAIPTSAGIYNSAGDLVRTLWTLQPTPAGRQQREWDGKDDLGRSLPPGTYSFKVVSAVDARNLGEIGNTGQPTNTSGHVPVNFESVAVDAQGNIFTVHDWDEAHFDVIQWSPQTGRAVANSGSCVVGLLKAIAVDDDAIYVTSYWDATKPKTAKFEIHKLKRTAAGIKRSTFTVAGSAIKVYDGNVIYPPNASPADLAMMHMPLMSIAVHGPLLYVTDSLAGLVRKYDKITGEPRGEMPVPLPCSVAVAPDGTIWVAHSHHAISAFREDGACLGTPIDNLADVSAIATGPGGDLYVADRGANIIRHYTITNGQPRLVGTLGGPAQPGDRAPDRYYRLRGVAADADGNIITIQNEYFFNGGRLAAFSPDGKPRWEQLGLEFQSIGTYASDDPNTFFTMMHHAYRLNRMGGTAEYLGNTVDGELYRGPNINGVPRVVKMGGKDLYYMPTGDGMEIFQIDSPTAPGRGPVLKLAAVIAGSQPLPDGTNAPRPWERKTFYLWSWHDAAGDHTPTPPTIHIASSPASRRTLWQHGPMDVDAEGTIWFVSYDRGGLTVESNAIYRIPCAGVDERSNPIYQWTDAQRYPVERSPWSVQLRTVVHGAGKMVYAYGNSATYPHSPQSRGLFMGGNMLVGFIGAHQKWLLPLPHVSVGMDVVPPASAGEPGGVLIGGDPFKGQVDYYTADGLLVCRMQPSTAMGVAPNVPTGCLDAYSAIAANRNPATGQLDVFVQDDYNDRILWYQVSDRHLSAITGLVTPIPQPGQAN